MRRKSMLVLGLAALSTLALAAAGCGGGGGSKNSAATTLAATTTEATLGTTTEAAVTTEAVTTTVAATTPGLSGVASAANCKQLEDLGRKFSKAFSGATSSQSLKKEAELLKEFAEKTPADIRPDFRLYAHFVAKLADVYGNVKPGSTPDAATVAKLQKFSASIDQAKLTAAAQHIASWVQKNCHA